MPTVGLVDDTSAAFAEIICADDDWIQAEFERLVAGALPTVTTDTVPSPREVNCAFVPPALHPTGAVGFWRKLLKKVRAPPHLEGRVRP